VALPHGTGASGLTIGIYVASVVGAIAIALLLPGLRNRAINLKIVGWTLIVAALGGLLLTMLRLATPDQPAPEIYFYIFAGLALFAAIKVITHPKPVYSALYFILTVLCSAGLYLLLMAEFMAFALIIVYAGAILITYLFVIMLAYQEADSTAADIAHDTDATSREPVAAATVGFLLLAVLASTITTQIGGVRPTSTDDPTDLVLRHLDRKVRESYLKHDLVDPAQEMIAVDVSAREAVFASLDEGAPPMVLSFPDDLAGENIESVGWSLLEDYPVSLELAGIILLMAMVGAVVFVRHTPSGVAETEDARIVHEETR
jgi:NADH-quinone oxidoreductase subunit J